MLELAKHEPRDKDRNAQWRFSALYRCQNGIVNSQSGPAAEARERDRERDREREREREREPHNYINTHQLRSSLECEPMDLEESEHAQQYLAE